MAEMRNITKIPRGYDLLLNHPVYGWIPFTARSDDPQTHGKVIYNEAHKAWQELHR